MDEKLAHIWADYNMGMITEEERNRRTYLVLCENPNIVAALNWFAEKLFEDAGSMGYCPNCHKQVEHFGECVCGTLI